MNRILLSSVWLVFYFWSSVVTENVYDGRRLRRTKRLIYGIDLSSHDELDTHYMVSLKKVYGCETAEKVQQNPLCDEYVHKCGGSLIASDFVLTACHCLVYETYFVKGVELPPFHPSFDEWTTTTTADPLKNQKIEEVYVRMQPLHPILNLMSAWMGSVENHNMPQRRFVKKFFPHSDCTVREVNVLSKSSYDEQLLWDLKPPQGIYDVGLVRTWEPFIINKDVKLIPFKLGNDMLEFHRKVMKSMKVCLFTGFGMTEYDDSSEYLRYSYRHTLCTTRCMKRPVEVLSCELCSTSIGRPDKGIRIIDVGYGDSGSPLVCDDNGKNILFGVLSAAERTPEAIKANTTNAILSAVVCIRDFMTTQHLQYLREQSDKGGPEKAVNMDKIHIGPFDPN